MFCDQGANVHLWLNSRMFWFFRLTLCSMKCVIKVILSHSNEFPSIRFKAAGTLTEQEKWSLACLFTWPLYFLGSDHYNSRSARYLFCTTFFWCWYYHNLLSIVRKRQVKYFCQNYCAINCLATLSQSSDFRSCKNKKGNLDIYFLYGYI